MRKKMMKVLAILALIAIISNFGIPGIVYPVITFASTATDYDFTDETGADRVGIGFTWEATTRTLTITAIKNAGAVIRLPENSTIDLQGNIENTVGYITCEGNLTIKGNDIAILKIPYLRTTNSNNAGINLEGMNVSGDLIIESGNIEIDDSYSSSGKVIRSFGIHAYSITINGGNLKITHSIYNSFGASGFSHAIWLSGTFTVNDGKVEAKSYNDIAINAGEFVVNGGDVIASSSSDYGIYSNVTINGGNVTSSGKAAFTSVPNIDPTSDWTILYNEDTTDLENAVATDITDIYKIYGSPIVKIIQNIHTTRVSLLTNNDNICVGEKVKFLVDVEPENTTDSITWSSSDENIATVSNNGEVTGIALGKTTIKVNAGEYSDSKDVNVVYRVTLDSNGEEGIGTEMLYTDINGKLESLPTLSTEGKDFIGWIDSDGNEVTTDTVFTQNTTIYAQWRERKISISEQKKSVKYGEEVTIAYDVTSNFSGTHKIKIDNLPEGVTLKSDEINFIEISDREYNGILELNVSNIANAGIKDDLIITVNDTFSSNFSLKIDPIAPIYEKPEGKTLEYTGTAQNLIIEGATADGVLEYSTNGTDYSTEIPKAINAREYTIYYRVKGDNNHYDSEVATIISVINKIDSKVETQPKGKTLQYNSTRQGLATAGTANGGIIEYSLDGETFLTNIPTGINAGEYTIYYRVKGDINHYDSKISTIVAVINKVDSKINIQPKGKALVYNSLEQELIEAGTTNDGKIQYSLDGKTFTTDIPKATEVGTYKIYYKILGDNNHYDSEIAAIVAVINKADSVMEKQPKGKTLEYNSLEQKLIEEGITNDGEILYSLDGKTFTTDIPQATEVGSYRIYYKVVGDSNHYDSEVNVTIAVINKIDSIIEIQPKGKTLVYNSISQELIEVGTTQDGEIQYSMDGQIFTTEIPTATDAGTYIIYYKVVGDNNHYDGAVSATVATINKIDSIIQTHPKEKTLVYNSVAQELIEAGTTQDGQIQYSIDGQTFSTEIPTGIEAGEYTIYYKLKGDNNHYDSELATIVAVINKIDSTIITLPNGRMLAYNSLEQELIEAGTTNDGIIEYSLDGENYSEQIPKATKVGAYKVYYRIKGDKNHLDFDDKSYVEAKIKIAFTDVEPTDWYYTAVEYNFANGMILGLNEITFAPNQTLTRAMLVTILHRMEGMPYVPGLSVFPDVQNTNSYYYLAVKWATQNGIVSGYNNGNFGPNDPITREQLAVILNNYCRYKGQYKTVNADLSKYADSDKISDYAKWGMNWAVGSGVITGNANDGTLNPQGTATRAEVASMLYKYCLNFK